jgi:peptide/nickel transport system permease protein
MRGSSLASLSRVELGASGVRLVMWLRRVLKARLAGVALLVVLAAISGALFAEVLSPYDPLRQDYSAVLQPPSRAHPLGTDNVGRDILARIIYGTRVSLAVGVVAVGIALTLGAIIGLVSGYWGGRIDDFLMRTVDAIWSFPSLVLALSMAAALGPGIDKVMIAVGVVSIPAFARLVRGQTLSVREREFVLAARALGGNDLRMLLRHIWPNVTAPVVVQASLNVATAIITEASLSFLGVGVRPPAPSWGSMLKIGYQYMEVAPWMSIFPGLAIFVTVLAFNLAGDGLREALDPRMARRR